MANVKQVIVRVTAEDEERRTRAYSRDRSWEFMKVACARFLSWSGQPWVPWVELSDLAPVVVLRRYRWQCRLSLQQNLMPLKRMWAEARTLKKHRACDNILRTRGYRWTLDSLDHSHRFTRGLEIQTCLEIEHGSTRLMGSRRRRAFFWTEVETETSWWKFVWSDSNSCTLIALISFSVFLYISCLFPAFFLKVPKALGYWGP